MLLLLVTMGCAGEREMRPLNADIRPSNAEMRPLIAEWAGESQRIVGSVDLSQGKGGGRVWLSHPNQEDLCEGAYKVGSGLRGTWSLLCTNGDTATGVLQAYGGGRGSAGIGTDSQGRHIRYVIGAEPGMRQPHRAKTPSVFDDVAPPNGEPIPIAAIEALFRYCVAMYPAAPSASIASRDYCQCIAREFRAKFSYQGFMTLIGELVAVRKAAGESRTAMHPQVWPVTHACAAGLPSPSPVSAR